MFYRKVLLGVCFLCFFAVCNASPLENPSEMFTELYEKYLKTEYEARTISTEGDGARMIFFDFNKKMSKDIFCQLEYYFSRRQIRYWVYKEDGEDIWYFHVKLFFSDTSFKLAYGDIMYNYFKYTNGLPYAFNDKTGKYDIQAETDIYQATNAEAFASIIDVIQNAERYPIVPRKGQ
jgi:hypothetical protein